MTVSLQHKDLLAASEGINHACFIKLEGENKTGLNNVSMHAAFKHNPDHAANAKVHSGAQTVAYKGGKANITIAGGPG